MKPYIWSGIATIFSLLLFYLWIGKETLRKIKDLYLCIIFTLPLSPLVNLAIKKNIGLALFSIFNLSEDSKSWPLWFIFVANIVSPVTEEAIKLLGILNSEVRRRLHNKKDAFTNGLILGSTFGIGEAWFLAYVLNLTQPEITNKSFIVLIGFGGERLLAIFGHAFMTAIVLTGFNVNPIKYYFLAVGFHYFVNIGAALYQTSHLSLEIAYIIISLALILLIRYIWRIERRLHKEGVSVIKEEVLYKR